MATRTISTKLAIEGEARNWSDKSEKYQCFFNKAANRVAVGAFLSVMGLAKECKAGLPGNQKSYVPAPDTVDP